VILILDKLDHSALQVW